MNSVFWNGNQISQSQSAWNLLPKPHALQTSFISILRLQNSNSQTAEFFVHLRGHRAEFYIPPRFEVSPREVFAENRPSSLLVAICIVAANKLPFDRAEVQMTVLTGTEGNLGGDEGTFGRKIVPKQ